MSPVCDGCGSTGVASMPPPPDGCVKGCVGDGWVGVVCPDGALTAVQPLLSHSYHPEFSAYRLPWFATSSSIADPSVN
jgi:hypothetical protein